MGKLLAVCLLAVVVVADARVKRGLGDVIGHGLGAIGSVILPPSATKAACEAAGLYNRERDGSPPNRKGGIFRPAGHVIGGVINTLGSDSTSESACITAGYYDPNLDEYGRPRVQGGTGGGLGGQGGTTINVHLNGQGQQQQQQNTHTTTYKCVRNGQTVPCDAATIAQAQG